MPVVFVSHGLPMVAIETGIYQEALERFGREHRPGAMVVISAHWESGDTVRIASAASIAWSTTLGASRVNCTS